MGKTVPYTTHDCDNNGIVMDGMLMGYAWENNGFFDVCTMPCLAPMNDWEWFFHSTYIVDDWGMVSDIVSTTMI